jgi:protein-tyrosine phosphatase
MNNHIQMEFSEVADWLLLGTNLCCEPHAARLHELDAQIDISLELERTPEVQGLESFIWLPVPDHEAPTFCQLDVGTAVLEEAEAKGYRAYLHCKNGHGRSPTMAIAYFIRKGMGSDEAEAFVRSKRPEIMPTDAQRARLKEYEQRLRTAHS